MNITDLIESFNFSAKISWKEKDNAEIGDFSIEDEKYQILIEHFTMNLELESGKVLTSADQVAFSRLESNVQIVDKIDSKSPNKVFGAVRNGILEKIDPKLDAVIFSAKKISGDSTDTFTKRSKLYERLAKSVWKQSTFGYIDQKHSDRNGDHFILVNKNLRLSNSEINEILKVIAQNKSFTSPNFVI